VKEGHPGLRQFLSVFALLLFCVSALGGQTGILALRQALLDAGNDGTLMCVAAHPDDEDGETLAYYGKKFGVRTVVVVATRGEGGQNEAGPELYEELAVLRTQEMERAGRITGAVYYNLNLLDFGFSRSAEETFAHWGHEEALRRLVHLIRQLKPQVIITNHHPGEGHGHHRAVAILVREAFGAAADSAVFRDDLPPWQVRRLYSRVRSESEATVSTNVAEYDPWHGETYAQIAARGLAEHRSQGMARFATRWHEVPRWTHYRLEKCFGSWPERRDDLFAGIDSITDSLASWLSLRSDDRPSLAGQAGRSLRPWPRRPLTGLLSSNGAPDSLLSALEALRQAQALLPPGRAALAYALQAKQEDLERATVQSLYLDLRATVDDSVAVPGQRIEVEASLFNGGPRAVEDVAYDLRTPPGWRVVSLDRASQATLSSGQLFQCKFAVQIPAEAKPTLPLTIHLYEAFRREPLLRVRARFAYRGRPLESEAAVPLEISPPLEVALIPEATMVPLSGKPTTKNFVLHLRNQSPDAVEGIVRFRGLAGVGSSPNPSLPTAVEFRLEREGEETAVTLPVTFPGSEKTGDYAVSVSVEAGDREPLVRTAKVRAMEVRVAPGLRVGLVKSFDVTLENALQALGVDSHWLTADDLRWGDLSGFDAILVDRRAYLRRDDLRANNHRLLEYVRKGGVAIVMYQKTFEWNPEYGNPRWGPYALQISQDRVTEENAPVEVLEAHHPLLNFPNQIGSEDWEGWVQERGLYFPGSWGSEYRPLLSMHDAGEKPLEGGLLVAKYGKGVYIYTSLVWYRQLRALVPGAYRMLANLVSVGRWRPQR